LSASDLVDTVILRLSRETPVLIHSMNAARAKLMSKRLAAAHFAVALLPMAAMTPDKLRVWLYGGRFGRLGRRGGHIEEVPIKSRILPCGSHNALK
jgi:hypothetical protein